MRQLALERFPAGQVIHRHHPPGNRPLGQPVPQGDFDAIRALSACTGAAAPAGLAELESRAERFGQVIDPADIPAAALGRL